MDSSPSSSLSNLSLDDLHNGRNPNNKLISNCLIALPLFSHPPFLHNSLFPPSLFKSPPPPPSHNKPYTNNLHSLLTTTTSHIVHDLRSSIASAAGSFFHVFSSHNPFLNKLFSLSDDFHNFCQIHRRRNYVNMRSVSNHNFAAILPGDSVAGIVVTNGILNFLNIYNTLLVVRLVLTWFPNSPPAIVSPLSTLCDPYLNIFRGIIPPLGGTLDLSPILAFLVLNALTSTASALPAELPLTGGEELSQQQTSSSSSLAPRATTSQKKWMTRFDLNKRKSSKTQ